MSGLNADLSEEVVFVLYLKQTTMPFVLSQDVMCIIQKHIYTKDTDNCAP